jgi:hypothetical protein
MRGGELFIEEAEDSFSNVLGGQAKVLNQFPGIARNAEAIGDAHHIELQGLAEILAVPQNCAGNDIPEAPDLVFFCGKQNARFVRRFEESPNIERLHGMNIHDARLNGVLFLQNPRGRIASGTMGPQAMMVTDSLSFL